MNSHSTFLGSSFLLNILSYLTLSIFGDNYWGLRLSSLLISIFFISTLMFAFNKITKDTGTANDKNLRWLSLLLLLILVTDFSFLFSNIVVEPTLLRLAASIGMILITNYFINKFPSAFWPFFLLGIMAIFSWVFIYLINVFIPVSIGLLLIINNLFAKQNLSKNILPYLLGLLAGVVCVISFAYLINIDLYNEIRYIASSFGGRTALTDAKEINYGKTIVINAINFFKPNFFNYNPLLLLLFAASTLAYLYILVKEKSERKISLAFVSIVFLILFFCQSLFFNDFFTRKGLISFPFYLIITFYVGCFIVTRMNAFKNSIVFITLLGALFIAGISQFTQNWIYHCQGSAFFLNTWSPKVLALLVLTAALISYIISKNIRVTFFVLLFSLIANNVYYSYEFGYKRITDDFKQSMMKIGTLIDDKNTIGAWSLGFRLYNSSKPALNPYMYYNKGDKYEQDLRSLVDKTNEAYIVSYNNDSLIQKMNLKPAISLANDYCTSQFVLYQIK